MAEIFLGLGFAVWIVTLGIALVFWLTKLISAIARLFNGDPLFRGPPAATFGAGTNDGVEPITSDQIPPSVTLDAVFFSITAPLAVIPDSKFELVFWAHLDEQLEKVLERARWTAGVPDASDLLYKSEGPFELRQGSRLSIRVRIPSFEVEPNQKRLLWMGKIASATFIVSVPAGTAHGKHAGHVSIRLNGLQIARMDFLLTVGLAREPVQPAPIPSTTTVHRTAFASYASQDRNEVLARVQGMEIAAKNLSVFVDVESLRSGELWERELEEAIRGADVFYLFWCRHAKESVWVEREWRYALGRRGLDFIDPVPLEPRPESALPPSELAMKQFYDPHLAFMRNTPHV